MAIAKETMKYAAYKNVSLNITVPEIRAVFAILMLSGYRQVPARRMYWSSNSRMLGFFFWSG